MTILSGALFKLTHLFTQQETTKDISDLGMLNQLLIKFDFYYSMAMGDNKDDRQKLDIW